MSALALLNLLNELRKSYIVRGLPSIISLCRNEFLNSIKQKYEYYYSIITWH